MHWYGHGHGNVHLVMTKEQAQSISHQGRCDEDVEELSKVPKIRRQLDKLDPGTLADELREWGAWDREELQDHEKNKIRILWVAACDLVGR